MILGGQTKAAAAAATFAFPAQKENKSRFGRF
jgi:hypothetical protein